MAGVGTFSHAGAPGERRSRARKTRTKPIAASALLLAMIGCSDSSGSRFFEGAEDPAFSIEGPVTEPGNPFISATSFPLSEVGYRQEEYFIAGTAHALNEDIALEPDGMWAVSEAEQADYKTRLMVIRPEDPADFNGTVLLEWLNVSGGLDAAPTWIMTHTEAIREGYAWVGVSAQRVGVEGSESALVNLGLKVINPDRYGELEHPGDSFSYAMFTHAARAVRERGDVALLDGLDVDRVIAGGQSQSAARLMTYVNAVEPRIDAIDGYLIHSRLGGSAPLSQAPQENIATPDVVRVRTDLNVPVIMLQTETDLLLLGSFADRQPDSLRFRLWEIAGSAHSDTYTVIVGPGDRGDDPSVADVLETEEAVPGIIECDEPINSGPQHFVARGALAALERWIRIGAAPAQADRLEVAGEPPAFVRDEIGNARGGVRTHYVEAPIAMLSGEGQTGGAFCFLFGTTALLSAQEIAERYPTRQDFIEAVAEATDTAAQSGFLTQADAALIRAWSESAEIDGL